MLTISSIHYPPHKQRYPHNKCNLKHINLLTSAYKQDYNGACKGCGPPSRCFLPTYINIPQYKVLNKLQ